MTHDEALEALGLSGTPTGDEIRRAHLEMARRYHPDLFATEREAVRDMANEKMRRLNEARAQLLEEARPIPEGHQAQQEHPRCAWTYKDGRRCPYPRSKESQSYCDGHARGGSAFDATAFDKIVQGFSRASEAVFGVPTDEAWVQRRAEPTLQADTQCHWVFPSGHRCPKNQSGSMEPVCADHLKEWGARPQDQGRDIPSKEDVEAAAEEYDDQNDPD